MYYINVNMMAQTKKTDGKMDVPQLRKNKLIRVAGIKHKIMVQQ